MFLIFDHFLGFLSGKFSKSSTFYKLWPNFFIFGPILIIKIPLFSVLGTQYPATAFFYYVKPLTPLKIINIYHVHSCDTRVTTLFTCFKSTYL